MATKTKKRKGGLPKWAIKQANGDFKKAWSLYKRGRKTKSSSKTKSKKRASRARRAGGAIKRRASRSVARMGSKRRAISINLVRTAAVVGTVGLMAGAGGGLNVWQQVKAGQYADAMNRLFLNFKKNWMLIVGLGVGSALLGRLFGRYAPKIGVPGAISVKAF